MTPEPAGGARIGAAVIDVLLLTGVFFALAAAFGKIESDDGTFSVELTGGPFLLYLLLFFSYYFVAESMTGRTIGKALTGVRVVAEDGSKPSSGRIAARTALRIVDVLPVLYLVGVVAMAVSKKKQRIGDMAAGTLVVKG